MVHFEGLLRCAAPGCDTLIEPHLGRCQMHRSKDAAPAPAGPSPSSKPANGPRPAAPTPPVEPKSAPCCGPIGAGCPQDETVDRNEGKRCPACRRELERLRSAG